MTQVFTCLLVLFFAMSSPAMERSADSWRSPLAAKAAPAMGVMAPDFSWLQTQKWWDQQMAPLRGTTSMSYPQSASAMLNMLPVLGGLKMAGEAMWGSDFVTGQRIENTTAHAAWAVANIGMSALGAVEAGVARTSVSALPTSARSADTIAEGWRISPYRVTTAGETFPRFESSQLPSRVSANGNEL